MSIVTTIRDYVEFINNFYDSVSGNFTLFQIFQQTLSYIFQTVLSFFSYILTFQWFRDFFNLPIIIPQISLAVLKDNFSSLDTKFQTSFFEKNSFFLGFLNSFFLSLPISCSNLIILRRLLWQGIPAGIAAACGSIGGQIFFLTTIFFGIRVFLIPWLYLDSVQYLIGLSLILGTVYSMYYERRAPNFFQSVSQREIFVVLGKIFLINFALAWTEQSCFFQYLGNLTFSSEPTILETLAGKNQLDFFFTHINYLFGIFLGCLFFYSLFYFFIILKWPGILYSAVIEKINFFLITAIIGLSLTSIPFYGLDYLVTKPLGFVSQDKILEKTIFNPGHLSAPLLDVFNDADKLNEPEVDISPFDRARYLESNHNTFEELNYQGEYAWKWRNDRKKIIGRDGSNDFLLKWLKTSGKQTELRKEPVEQSSTTSQSSSVPQENEQVNQPELAFFTFADTNFSSHNYFLLQFGPPSFQEIEIKKKYYSNPVFKQLLKTDIDFFLLRQPSSHFLTVEDEKNLFDKRLKLAEYYDSERFYKNLSNLAEFKETFQGSKSYADRVYNQQFKGTLNIVRRLFSVTLNENVSNFRVLKYDQPLYTNQEEKNKGLPFFHEETPLELTKVEPYLEKLEAKPFYAGWDNDQRKFIITNRFLPRSLAGYNFSPNTFNTNLSRDFWENKNNSSSNENPGFIKNEMQPNGKKISNLIQTDKQNRNQKKAGFENKVFDKVIEFTAWPLSPILLENQIENRAQNIPYTVLFQLKNPNIEEIEQYLEQLNESQENNVALVDKGFFSTLPTNILFDIRLDSNSNPNLFFDNVAPKRGGFIWPGGAELKLNFSNLKK